MPENYSTQMFESKRAIRIESGPTDKPLLSWMNRDQRLIDNHALAFAQSLAMEY